MNKWIIVIAVNNGNEDEYMVAKDSEGAAMGYIMNMTDEETLERLFTVNEFGDVQHKQVVWEGKLKIKDKPSKDWSDMV